MQISLKHKHTKTFPAWGFFIVALVLGCFLAGAGPKVSVSVSDHWVQYVPYEAPNEQKTKWQCSGDSADSIPNSKMFAVKNVKIQRFTLEEGQVDLTAESPTCIYDLEKTLISSTSKLKVNAENGRYLLEGVGFLLEQTNSVLMISNEVHSTIRNTERESTNLMETAIDSVFCQFRMQTTNEDGQAIYRQSVHVKNPRMELTCENLTARIPRNPSSQAHEQNQVRQILAQSNVVMDFKTTNSETIHANCDRAEYSVIAGNSPSNVIVVLSGNPRIELPGGWISADTLVLNSTDNTIRGTNHVHLHLLQIPSLASLPSSLGNATNSLDVYSANFVFDRNSNTATFLQNVKAFNPQFAIQGAYLLADIPNSGKTSATPRLNRLVVQTNVIMDFLTANSTKTNHAIAQKAVYETVVRDGKTNQWLTLSEGPSISVSNATMTADVIEANPNTGDILGKGHNHTTIRKRPEDSGPLQTEIFSTDFSYSTNTGVMVYEGSVTGFNPSVNFSGNKVTLQLAKNQPRHTNQIDSLLAEGNVAFQLANKRFQANDITNLNAFTQRLSKPSNAFENFVMSALLEETRSLLSKHTSKEEELLKKSLANDFNALTLKDGLLTEANSSGIALSKSTTDLAARSPKGAEWVQLNRMILMDAFDGVLFRNSSGELIHGTGERLVYQYNIINNQTNETVELIGNPRLELGNGWATAEDRIFSDRVTGVTRAYGHPHFFTRAEGFSAKPLPELPKSKPKSKNPNP